MVYFYFAYQKAIHGFLISIYGSESTFRSRGNHPWFSLYRTQKASLLTKTPFNLLFVCGIINLVNQKAVLLEGDMFLRNI